MKCQAKVTMQKTLYQCLLNNILNPFMHYNWIEVQLIFLPSPNARRTSIAFIGIDSSQKRRRSQQSSIVVSVRRFRHFGTIDVVSPVFYVIGQKKKGLKLFSHRELKCSSINDQICSIKLFLSNVTKIILRQFWNQSECVINWSK